MPSVVVSEGVEPIGIAEGPYQGKPNPHAWMSPADALIYVEQHPRRAGRGIDPANAATYAANAEAYKAEIRAAAAPIRAELAAIPAERRWLATSEGAFSYLARDFGLRRALHLADQRRPAGHAAAGPPGDRRDARARHAGDLLREHRHPTPARQVARETGANYGGVLYVDSLSDADGPVPTYIDMLRVTTGTIAAALAP